MSPDGTSGEESRAVEELEREAAEGLFETAASGPSGRTWKRVVKRVAIGIGVAVLALVVLGVLLYSFGGMERPAPEYRAAYEQMVAQGTAAPIERRFVIPIPGCRCHSSDPAQQMQHSLYRIRECMSCHSGS